MCLRFKNAPFEISGIELKLLEVNISFTMRSDSCGFLILLHSRNQPLIVHYASCAAIGDRSFAFYVLLCNRCHRALQYQNINIPEYY